MLGIKLAIYKRNLNSLWQNIDFDCDFHNREPDVVRLHSTGYIGSARTLCRQLTKVYIRKYAKNISEFEQTTVKELFETLGKT